jgi:hypothetical protein
MFEPLTIAFVFPLVRDATGGYHAGEGSVHPGGGDIGKQPVALRGGKPWANTIVVNV